VPLMAVMTVLRAKGFDQQIPKTIADWSAVGVAVSLPWSTSAAAIFIVVWLLAFIATLDVAAVKREISSVAGGLPVLLWLLGAVGMLWADVSWQERFGGLGGFNKLLLIPLLLCHFRSSERGWRVLLGFFVSVCVLLAVSWWLVLVPGFIDYSKSIGQPGVLVRNYIIQSTEFLICAFVLLGNVAEAKWDEWHRSLLKLVLAAIFLANIFFVVDSRTSLLVIPILAFLLGGRRFGWKGLAGAGLLCCVVAGVVWAGSPYLRDRFKISVAELHSYEKVDAVNSTGLHIELLKKSFSFVESAPVIGHGTGSIPEQFRNAVHDTGSSAIAAVNPHNQIFGVAIQLGLVGALVLAAMWFSHFLLFCSGGFIAWVGMVVVTQNIVSSLFNSHLFDFAEGWLYVFGVGVVGGMVLRERDKRFAARPVTES
jgi:O-antigen ligase